MLACARRLLPSTTLRALSCCAAEATAADGLVPTQPGSVSEHSQHLLLQLPRPADAGDAGGGAWWPDVIEREAAVMAAFAAVAKNEEVIVGKVKITAFNDVTYGGRPASPGPPPGSCNLLAFPAGLRFDGLSIEQLGLAVVLATAANPSHTGLTTADRKALTARMAPLPDLSLFVCTHAARDARCGLAGPPLAAALQRLVWQRKLQQHIRVFQTSHIGGHKYAGNVVTYGAMHPCDGDWFGGLHAGNAEAFLDGLLGVEVGVDGGVGDPVLRPFWRGRMGLSKLEQQELWEEGGLVEDLAGTSEEEGEEGSEDSEGDERLERVAAEWEQRRGELG